jgi:hypothetical protein
MSQMQFNTGITRRCFMALAETSLAAISCRGCSAAMRGSERKPNVLFVLTDDQRFDAMGLA